MVKIQRWINFYYSKIEGLYSGDGLYDSQEEADQAANTCRVDSRMVEIELTEDAAKEVERWESDEAL